MAPHPTAPDSVDQAQPVAALILSHYSALSAGHRRLADFILKRRHEAALMTLERLAQASGVSIATANRLPAKLGLNGHPELKALLRQELEAALRPVEALVDDAGFAGLSATAPWTRSLEADVQRIRHVTASEGDQSYAEAAHLLAGARQVYMAGLGASAYLARYAAYCFSSVRDGVEAIVDEGGRETFSRRLLAARPEDVALVIGFARYSRELPRYAERLHAAGVTIIAVTDDQRSPLGPYAKICFVVPRLPGFAFSSAGAGALAVVEALMRSAVVAMGKEAVEERSAQLAGLLEDVVFVPEAQD
jgi:DNA-binding MurR/RpiR family transcriptional regulator